MELANTLLALIATLIGAGVYVVKALLARSDRLIESRDSQIEAALNSLTSAVETFRSVDRSKDSAHAEILTGLRGVATSLDALANRIDTMEQNHR